ncbi:MAG: GNAT family N-acetyltransferase [Dehalococcoidia bacterium]
MTTIRRAKVEEAAAVTAVINAAYVVEAYFKVHPERTDQAEIAHRIATEHVMVAEAGGSIAGAVVVNTTAPEGHFGMLSVAPAHQGRGIARELVDTAERLCREGGCASVAIEVVHLRTELFPFYEKLGYAVYGMAPFPVPEQLSQPVHFLLMSKSLAATPAQAAQEAARWAPVSH